MQRLLNGEDRVTEAIRTLKEHEPEKGYVLAFSGGKDSIVCYDLAKRAEVKFTAKYSMTTIDPPEVTRFIRQNYPDVEWKHPIHKGKRTNFYELVSAKGLPSRTVRWCCDILKESGNTKGETLIMGVRRAESAKRANRPLYQTRGGVHLLNPIIDWEDMDVWEYIHQNNLPYPTIYDEGSKRVGCIMCPLSCRKARVRDYKKYPSHVKALENALSKYLEAKPESSMLKWGNTAEEIIYFWIHDSPIESAKGTCMQTALEEVTP